MNIENIDIVYSEKSFTKLVGLFYKQAITFNQHMDNVLRAACNEMLAKQAQEMA